MQEIISNLDYIEYEIDENYDGLRIDKALANLNPNLSRNQIQTLIDEGFIICNDKGVKSSLKVFVGDKIRQYEKIVEDDNIEPENIPLDIVYEDDDLLVINKPSGMVVHPAAGHYTGTLVNALLYHFNIESKDKIRPGIVHRLDKDTSGVMLVAKNEWTHERLSDMISKKDVKRHYLAIVNGLIKHDTGTIDAPIGRDPNNRQQMTVTDINAKDAITHFRVLKQYKENTLLECILETGRTHQIRVHLAYIGYPVNNDPTYCKKKATDFGQMLHSK